MIRYTVQKYAFIFIYIYRKVIYFHSPKYRNTKSNIYDANFIMCFKLFFISSIITHYVTNICTILWQCNNKQFYSFYLTRKVLETSNEIYWKMYKLSAVENGIERLKTTISVWIFRYSLFPEKSICRYIKYSKWMMGNPKDYP